MESLLRGWPEHEDLENILREARSSLSPELRLVAIMGRVQFDQQDEEDRKELLGFGSRGLNVDYDWQREVVPTLVAGWPGSREVKELCFSDLRGPRSGNRGLNPDVALRVLLEGYPQDEEVAEYCAEEIRTERRPFVLLHSEAWSLLARNFKDHPKVVSATDEWIPKQETQLSHDLAQAALVGRTPLAKAKLLSLLDSSGFDHIYARALLEGWGLQDAEVAEKLGRIAFGPAAKASRLGAVLPHRPETTGTSAATPTSGDAAGGTGRPEAPASEPCRRYRRRAGESVANLADEPDAIPTPILPTIVDLPSSNPGLSPPRRRARSVPRPCSNDRRRRSPTSSPSSPAGRSGSRERQSQRTG